MPTLASAEVKNHTDSIHTPPEITMHISLHLPQTLPAFPGSVLWRVAQTWLERKALGAPRASSPVQALIKGSTLTLQQPQGLRIDCVEGCVWITLDGDTRDTVLEAGSSFRADRQQRALVHALEPSQVRVSPVTCVKTA